MNGIGMYSAGRASENRLIGIDVSLRISGEENEGMVVALPWYSFMAANSRFCLCRLQPQKAPKPSRTSAASPPITPPTIPPILGLLFDDAEDPDPEDFTSLQRKVNATGRGPPGEIHTLERARRTLHLVLRCLSRPALKSLRCRHYMSWRTGTQCLSGTPFREQIQ